MRKMMDLVQFSFENSRNRLTMVKMHPPIMPDDKTSASKYHEIQPGLWLVTPDGRLDAATAPALEASLNQILEKGNIWIVVNMSQVSYIASRGLKTLVSAWRKAGDAGGNLVLFGMAKRVAQVFETVGFLHIFDIYETGEDAEAAFLNSKE
jgi:anti-sigma B factor antagonist